eukprot:3748148-Prymnesium_polylepis.2
MIFARAVGDIFAQGNQQRATHEGTQDRQLLRLGEKVRADDRRYRGGECPRGARPRLAGQGARPSRLHRLHLDGLIEPQRVTAHTPQLTYRVVMAHALTELNNHAVDSCCRLWATCMPAPPAPSQLRLTRNPLRLLPHIDSYSGCAPAGERAMMRRQSRFCRSHSRLYWAAALRRRPKAGYTSK